VLSQLPVDLFPPDTYAFIAGGYAACPERATDIDVWVRSDENLEVVRAKLLVWLDEHRWAYAEEKQEEKFRADGFGYDKMDCRILKVAVVPYTKPIHIMVTGAPPLVLLRNFDVSTHQIARVPHPFCPDGDTMRGPEWTPLSEEPVQLKETSATPARLEKIRTRYADLRTDGQINNG
jgi:hypothetical protein